MFRREQQPSLRNHARTGRGATWLETADHIRCTPSPLSGLRTGEFATAMELAMRITQAQR